MPPFSERLKEWHRSLHGQSVKPELKPTTTGIPYHPLDPSKDEIRLLELLPNRSVRPPEKGPTIQCVLRHASLGEAEYTALSYVWGDPTQKTAITVQYEWPDVYGNLSKEIVSVLVTVNLASALLHLRYSRKPLVLWIDAICINQVDVAEKSSQIMKMADIYERARNTVVWLGPAADDSDKVMKDLWYLGFDARRYRFFGPGNRLDLILSEFSNWHTKGKYPRDDRGRSLESFMLEIYAQGLGKGYKAFRDLQALETFLNRPWWTRVWVLQEFGKSKAVTFLCGLAILEDTYLCPAIQAISGYWHYLENARYMHGLQFLTPLQQEFWSHKELAHHQSQMVGWQQAVTEKRALTAVIARRATENHAWIKEAFGANGEDFRLGTVLEWFRGPSTNSTDPRDRIYGVLGLCSDNDKLRIVPDYTQSPEMIFTSAMRSMLAGNHGQVLCQAQPHHAKLNVPSWVVDWTSDDDTNIMPTTGPVDYETSGGTHVYLGPSQVPEYLCIEGVRLGTISTISPTGKEIFDRDVPGFESGAESFSMTQQRFRWWMIEMVKVIAISLPMLDHMALKEVMFRILSCDPLATTDLNIEREHEHATWENFRVLNAMHWKQDPDSIDHSSLGPFCMLTSLCYEQRVIGTGDGFVGYGHHPVQVGDVLAIFFGVDVPMIIRPSSSGRFRIVGTAFVDGVMMGEKIKRGDYVVESFTHE
jgi:hypothetical protein